MKASTVTAATQKLMVMTAKSWKTSILAKYGAPDCLVINEYMLGIYVESVNCSLCKKYKSSISSIENFTPTWVNEESKCLQHNAVLMRVKGEPHKAALVKLLKAERKITRECSDDFR